MSMINYLILPLAEASFTTLVNHADYTATCITQTGIQRVVLSLEKHTSTRKNKHLACEIGDYQRFI